MSRKTGRENPNNIDEERDHYPERILSSRRCKNCEILSRAKNKKSKYKCMACSIKFQVDVPLCISCFGEFHEEVLPLCGHSKLK